MKMSLIKLSLPRPRQQRLAVESLRAALRADGVLRALVHRDARVLAARVEYVELYAEGWIAVLVEETFLDGVRLDASQSLHPRVLRAASTPHLLDDEERAEVEKIRFAPTRRARRTDRAVNV